jgi:hypothetical protein
MPRRSTPPRHRTFGHRTVPCPMTPRPMPWKTPRVVDRGRARNSATTAASTRTVAGEPSNAAPVRPPPSVAARASAGAAIRPWTAPARRPHALRSRARRRASTAEPPATDAVGFSIAVRARPRISAEAAESTYVDTRRRSMAAWGPAFPRPARTRTSVADPPGMAATPSFSAGRVRRRSPVAAEGCRVSAAAARASSRRARSSATSADRRATDVAVCWIAADAVRRHAAFAGNAGAPRSGRTGDRRAFRGRVRSHRPPAALRGTAAATRSHAGWGACPGHAVAAPCPPWSSAPARRSPAGTRASTAAPRAMGAATSSIAGRASRPRFAAEEDRASADRARSYGRPELRAEDRVDRGAVDVLIEADDLAVGDLEDVGHAGGGETAVLAATSSRLASGPTTDSGASR